MSGRSNSASDGTPVRLFRSRSDWAAWLEKNHRKCNGLWLRPARRACGVQSVTYGEALEVALCYGWVDGQKNSDTDQTWLQKFCPRSRQSIGSKINRGKALTLIESGIMQPAGLEAVQRAKTGAGETPMIRQVALVCRVICRQHWVQIRARRPSLKGLDRQNRYAVVFRILTVNKAETRARKTCEFVEMLERNEKIHESGRARRSPK